MIFMQNSDFTKSYFLHILNKYYSNRRPIYPTYLINSDFPDAFYMNPDIDELPTKTVRWPCRWLNSPRQRQLPVNYTVIKMNHKKYIPQIRKPEVFNVEYIKKYQEHLPLCFIMNKRYQGLGYIACPWLCYPDNETLRRFRYRMPVTTEMLENAMKGRQIDEYFVG